MIGSPVVRRAEGAGRVGGGRRGRRRKWTMASRMSLVPEKGNGGNLLERGAREESLKHARSSTEEKQE